MSIRFKVILPYLLLTLIVAVTGAYIVTRLVSSSLNERLENQLVEAGRVVSDTMARQEIRQLEAARLIAYTRGLGEAVQAGDNDRVRALAQPAAGGLNASNACTGSGASSIASSRRRAVAGPMPATSSAAR